MERKDKMPLDKSINKDRSTSTDNRGAGQGQSQGGVKQGGLQQDKFHDKTNKTTGSTGAAGSSTNSTFGSKYK